MSYLYNSMKLKDLYLEIDSNIELLNILDFNILDRLTKRQVSKLFLNHPAEIFSSKLFHKVSMNCIYNFLYNDPNGFHLLKTILWRWRYWDWYNLFYIIFNNKDYDKMEIFKRVYEDYKIKQIYDRKINLMNTTLYPYEINHWYKLSSIDLYRVIDYQPEYLSKYVYGKKFWWKISAYHWGLLSNKVDKNYINKKYLEDGK